MQISLLHLGESDLECNNLLQKGVAEEGKSYCFSFVFFAHISHFLCLESALKLNRCRSLICMMLKLCYSGILSHTCRWCLVAQKGVFGGAGELGQMCTKKSVASILLHCGNNHTSIFLRFEDCHQERAKNHLG